MSQNKCTLYKWIASSYTNKEKEGRGRGGEGYKVEEGLLLGGEGERIHLIQGIKL